MTPELQAIGERKSSVTTLTQDELKSEVIYDPDTGLFTWKRTKSGRKSSFGSKFDGRGYLRATINGRSYFLHRLAFFYMTGRWPKMTDHINHIGSDNRWVNLREVSAVENNRNLGLAKTNTSGVTGVYFNKTFKSWRARIIRNGKYLDLGSFAEKDDAVKARKDAERIYGYHENHGLNTLELRGIK